MAKSFIGPIDRVARALAAAPDPRPPQPTSATLKVSSPAAYPGLEVPATTVVVPKKLPEFLRNNGEELLLAESFVEEFIMITAV